MSNNEVQKNQQQMVFSRVAKNISNKLPKRLSLMAELNDQVKVDLNQLTDAGLLAWDLPFKASCSYMEAVSNYEHILTCVAYYGDDVDKYACVGYALGCVNIDQTAIEMNYIEKSREAHHDLAQQIFPVMVNAFYAYAKFLNVKKEADIKEFILVDPVENVISYYEKFGFELNDKHPEDNRKVMVLSLKP